MEKNLNIQSDPAALGKLGYCLVKMEKIGKLAGHDTKAFER